jgi:CHAT domain-containing protein/tetratricopeptide (TPR) repeat protein
MKARILLLCLLLLCAFTAAAQITPVNLETGDTIQRRIIEGKPHLFQFGLKDKKVTGSVIISLVRVNKNSSLPDKELIERGETFQQLTVDISEFDLVRAPMAGHNSGPIIDVKTAITKHRHERGEVIGVRIAAPPEKHLVVGVLAVNSIGEVFNLLDYEAEYSDHAEDVSLINTGDEVITYVAVVTPWNLTISFNEGVAIGRGAKQVVGAAMMTNLGAVYGKVGLIDQSIEFYELTILLAKARGKKNDEAAAFNNLGLAYYALSRYDKAIQNYQKALDILAHMRANHVERLRGEASTLNNLAQVYNALARFELAVETYLKSLVLKRRLKDKEGEYVLLNNLGAAHNLPGKYERAIGFYRQALVLAHVRRDKRGEAITLNNLASAYRAIGRFKEAEQLIGQSRTLNAQHGVLFPSQNLAAEAFALNNLGLLRFGQGKFGEAADMYQQALEIFREIKNRGAEAVALNNLMVTYKELSQPHLAIYYGKQSVNSIQKIRKEVVTLDKETQASFLHSRTETYRRLADILISEGRLPEAQAVLDLLKQEEYEQLATQRTRYRTDEVPYSKVEADLMARVEELATARRRREELERLKRIREELVRLKRRTEALSADEQKQLDDTLVEIEAANKAFRLALDVLAKAEINVTDRVDEIQNEKNLQRALKKLKDELSTGAVALYTVVGAEEEDEKVKPINEKRRLKFGWIILVTPDSRKAYPIDVQDLEETVFKFRTALSSPYYDPQPLAEKLYAKLFRQSSEKQKRTLEADLESAMENYPDRTIMWSLDGVLRYIPMAALHDGKHYLVENYRHIVFTKQSLLLLDEKDASKWEALGLGVSEAKSVDQQNFAALDGVKRELEDIVRQPDETNGILDGTRRLDKDFTKDATIRLWREGKYPVIHIATHFSFNPLDQKASFLLIGDGKLTFADIQDKDNLFSSVDLMTLSACDTAMVSNGKESEGFTFLAQSLGAKSVIASLWKVSDAGTPELMLRFYKLRAENPNLPKGEAFRRAQLALLRGEARNKTDDPKDDKIPRAKLVTTSGTKMSLPAYSFDSQKPYAHPYYWAPFILIGNWR